MRWTPLHPGRFSQSRRKVDSLSPFAALLAAHSTHQLVHPDVIPLLPAVGARAGTRNNSHTSVWHHSLSDARGPITYHKLPRSR